MARWNLTLEQRFWVKVDRAGGASDCWQWRGCLGRNGYGRVWCNGRTDMAHRVAWLLTNGQIDENLCVCHRCDTPSCMNPAHLFLGTHADNVADKVAKGRQPSGNNHYSRVHPERMARGSTHYAAKLTDDDVRSIRSDARWQRLIAADYGVSQTLISQIKRLKVWAHLDSRS